MIGFIKTFFIKIFDFIIFVLSICLRKDNLIIFKLDEELGAILPSRATQQSAGYDLYCIDDIVIPSKTFKLISTGVRCQMPNTVFGKIECRSSLAMKGFSVLGGVIDSDYRGEIKVILLNNSNIDYTFNKNERIAQLVFIKILNNPFVDINNNLSDTSRNQSGFGSSGK